MKEKIIQIVRNIASASGDSLADVADIYEENYFKKEIEELSTLIQESNREAVEGFVREFNNKCLHDSINESYNYPLEEIPNVVYSFVEEYLSSIGKDEE